MKLVLKTVLPIAFICGIPATQAATSDGKIWGFCGLVTCSGLCCTNLSSKAYQLYNFQMTKPAPKIYRTTNWSSYMSSILRKIN